MVDIRHHGTCDAPLEVAFAYLDDYLNVSKWMFGIASFAPAAGKPSRGPGATFEATFAVKPVRISSTVEVTEYVENEIIAFHSIKGFTNSSTWRFSPAGPEQTAIDVVFSYELPGGLAGKALGRALEPIVALSIRESDRQLRKHVADYYAATRR